ncbi:hypothetical protein L0V05_15770 [Tabrizicola sp. J26]|uniref:hypothetical protein n=1 Tax=Alitabrizicola rongguiensis TaxID=2909234 RepID=UPI001F22ADE8|nr:hypothetical protein [Tabrizicola rongguiensis]MCF1710271.1 hypothetical protein [Tabrizicola rongguiensis]
MQLVGYTLAALLGTVGVAQAAIYNLSFITDAPRGQTSIVLQLPSLSNVHISQLVDMESSDDCECGYFDPPIVHPSKVPSNATSSFELLTDSVGKIIEISYYYSEDFFAWSWNKSSFTESLWSDEESSETYAGYWRVAAVPLPATAPLLAGGAALMVLAARKRRYQ